MLYSTIESLCPSNFKRRMRKFFDPEVETFSASIIINSLAKLITNHPIHTMVGLSLINYVASKIADEDDDSLPPELDSANISSNSEEQTHSEIKVNSLYEEFTKVNVSQGVPDGQEQLLTETSINEALNCEDDTPMIIHREADC